MHTSNPPKQECLGLDILQLDDSEKFNVKCFEFLIDYGDHALQDRSVVL